MAKEASCQCHESMFVLSLSINQNTIFGFEMVGLVDFPFKIMGSAFCKKISHQIYIYISLLFALRVQRFPVLW